MPPLEDEDKYDTLTASFKNVSGDGVTAAGSDLAVLEVDHLAQLTNLRVTGANVELYDVVVRDQDGANPSVERTYVGSDLDEGDFEDPALSEIGAQKEVAIINREQLADANYGINVRVDQIDRGAEG